jgi:hypothetical protein
MEGNWKQAIRMNSIGWATDGHYRILSVGQLPRRSWDKVFWRLNPL